MTSGLLELREIRKAFPGVVALDGVNFSCEKGEVHALVGENGAGKSTLMKILVGALQPDAGEIILRGQRAVISDPNAARRLGISIIYQELNLIPHLTIAENVLLGQEIVGPLGVVDWQELRQQAQEALDSLGANLDASASARGLRIAQQQLVEIAKALVGRTEIVIMDEPTASLSEEETQRLFQIIRQLRDEGRTVIYISHRLPEIFELADRATVLKDGKLVGTRNIAETNRDDLVRMMVGRELGDCLPEPSSETNGSELLRVRSLTGRSLVKDVNFSLHAGEILAIVGLQGQGQRELARMLFGAEPIEGGEIAIDGKRVAVRSPRDAIAAGIGFVSDDRKGEGLILSETVAHNVSLASLRQLLRAGFVSRAKEKALVNKMLEYLEIRFSSLDQEVSSLSGGNQQKIVLARWLATNARVLLLCEPTRGIDVGAKLEVYQLMRRLTEEGAGLLMVSSDLPEVLGVSDRILVMYGGELVAEVQCHEASEEKLMAAMIGHSRTGV